MIDETWETIIHEELDGVATPADRVRLYDLMSRDPEVRAYYEEMCRVSGALHRVPVLEPPASLKTRILATIERMSPRWLADHTPEQKPSWMAELRHAFAARPIWGGGFVFAAGVATALIIFAFIGQSPTLDTQDLTGSMTPPEQFERLGTKPLHMDGLEGRMETGLSPQGPCLYLELESSQPAEITVGFAGRMNAFRGFHQANPANGLVSFDAGGLRILHNGENRYLLTEAPASSVPTEVLVRVQVGESILEERLPFTR